MWLTDKAVDNRVAVLAFAALTCIAGIFAYRSLPLEAAPEVKLPHVFVTTRYRGVSPEDIEKSITVKIEDKLKGISGVKKIRSVSSEGLSQIDIEFVTGVDIDQAKIKVKDKVDLARPELPTDLDDDPEVTEINVAEWPILTIALSGAVGMRALTHLAEELKRELEGIQGVLEVEMSGDVEREIQIQVSPLRLALYAIPFSILENAVRSENANVSGGSIRLEDGRFQLRVPAEFTDVAAIGNIVVGTRGGEPVYLRDVAEIVDGIKDRVSYARVNGRDAVSLSVKKRTGANIVEIADEVQKALARARQRFPPSVTATLLMDRAKDIREQVWDLENNMATGFALVVAVVLLFLGLRNALAVAAIIPLSMLMAFIVLAMRGITLNFVVLFSLTLATGMLVDTAIVVIENIYRFMSQGVPPLDAARAAAGEVIWPVIGSGLTTLAAFVPFLWWPGIVGEFMSYLPKTLIIVLTCNLLAAIFISPALAAVFVRAKTSSPVRSAAEVISAGEHPMLSGGGRIIAVYRRLLQLALRHRLATVTLAGALCVLFFLLWMQRVGVAMPVEFLPHSSPRQAYANLRVPEGLDVDACDALVKEAAVRIMAGEAGSTAEILGDIPRLRYEDAIANPRRRQYATSGEPYLSWSDLPDIVYIHEQASAIGGMALFGGLSPNRIGVEFAPLTERMADSRATAKTLAERVREIAGAEVRVDEQQRGPPTGAAINIEISGEDFALLGQAAAEVRRLLGQAPFVKNIRDDYERGAPTLHIEVDRARAALLGLSSQAIGFALRAAINGIEVSTFRESEKDHDIVVRFLDRDRRSIETLRQIFLPTPVAGLVPLTTVARISYTGGFGKITRINQRRVVTVQADADQTRTTNDTARAEAERLLALHADALPAGCAYAFTGEYEFQQEATSFLPRAFAAAVLLVAILLIAQFNSILLPLIIISEVALSLGGAFLGLWLFARPFGIVMAGIGVISLAGVVVNNGIVLLDYTRQLIDRGMPRHDAIVAAGATRLRPVFLTATTTMLAVVPILTGVSFDFHHWQVIWQSESAEWWLSMAVVIFFGLGLATLLTLVVVPALFSLTEDAREWARASGYAAFCTALLAGAPAAAAVASAMASAAPWIVWLAVLGLLLYQTPLAQRWRTAYWRWWWRRFDARHGTDFAVRYAALPSASPRGYKENE